MQIDYDQFENLRTAGWWNFPQLYNGLQDVDVPPVYAPYRTAGFWPGLPANIAGNFGAPGSGGAGGGSSVAASSPAASSSIAPNSGAGTTVASAMMAINTPQAQASPAATPLIASATGQSVGPATLVSPMPSITAIPAPANTTPAPAGMCAVNSWVANNPVWAGIAVIGIFVLFKGMKK